MKKPTDVPSDASHDVSQEMAEAATDANVQVLWGTFGLLARPLPRT